jgi:hypothetical protein
MSDATMSPEMLARQAIERCRRDIEIAWTHIETARVLLRRSRWMLERWIAESKANTAAGRPEQESLAAPVDAPAVHRHRGHRRRKRAAISRRRGIVHRGSAHVRRLRGSP